MQPAIVWFRQDLRVQDNSALAAAIARGGPVVPVYILDDASDGQWKPGAASRWWRHHSLRALEASLRQRGSRLVLRRGDAEAELGLLVREVGAGAVYWNRRYELPGSLNDTWIGGQLRRNGIEVRDFAGALLHEPHGVATKQGTPFQVFTPFWRQCSSFPVAHAATIRARSLAAPERWPGSLELDELALLPRVDWAAGMAKAWEPGERGAHMRWQRFIRRGVESYATDRDDLGRDGTSRMSPHLHFGEISPRQMWAAIRALGSDAGLFPPHRGASVFLKEVGWREFAHHLLVHFPQTPELPLRGAFAEFPWAADPGGLKLRAWQRGKTGYPIVDAAMRQLWAIGWMHNRARMIVASFLVKHLRLPWRAGAEWFWDTLVDADLANNTLGWQWSAGCGADAAPYFRIFAPVRQGQKFDPLGAYVRAWVPELERLPTAYIHAPWTAPESVLSAAGVKLNGNYPRPIVDHAEARAGALEAFRSLRARTTAA